MPLTALVFYMQSKHEYELRRDMEREHRADYDTTMLYFIAQPTRKYPGNLPQYKPLFAENDDSDNREREKTGEEILLELVGS